MFDVGPQVGDTPRPVASDVVGGTGVAHRDDGVLAVDDHARRTRGVPEAVEVVVRPTLARGRRQPVRLVVVDAHHHVVAVEVSDGV